MPLHDRSTWKPRWRPAGEPLIWHDTRFLGNRDYTKHTEVFVENVLWEELDALFPDQLNALPVGR